MPKSPTKRRPVTVAAVLDAGLATFLERGFHGASIHDITAAANLTRGAFYSNFPTKEALFLAVYDRKTEEILQELRRLLDSAPTEVDTVPLLLDYAANGGAGGDDWILVLAEFTVHAARDSALRAEFAAHRAHFTGKLAALISDVAAANDRRSDAGVDHLAGAIIALHEGAALLRVSNPAGDAVFARMASVLVDAFTPIRERGLESDLDSRKVGD
jgi:AcrR family transcriptional regulator